MDFENDVMYYPIRQYVVDFELAGPWWELLNNFNSPDERLDTGLSNSCCAFQRSWPKMLCFGDICHPIAHPSNHTFTATLHYHITLQVHQTFGAGLSDINLPSVKFRGRRGNIWARNNE
jgi:hypothetical protein